MSSVKPIIIEIRKNLTLHCLYRNSSYALVKIFKIIKINHYIAYHFTKMAFPLYVHIHIIYLYIYAVDESGFRILEISRKLSI